MAIPDKQPADGIEWLIDSANKGAKDQARVDRSTYVTEWITPTLLNSFAAPSPPKEVVKYRYHFKVGRLEFKGHVNVAGAVSATVAFVIVEPFWPEFDESTITDVTNGASFSTARYAIDSTNGNVTITFPAI